MRFFAIIRKYYVFAVIGIVILFIPSIAIYRSIKTHCINNYPVMIRAVIINEKNLYGNSPVSKEFSYSYSFYVKGENYKGNSFNSSLNINDSITIEYCSFFPKFNRLKK
jgi:hypothetical protein